MSRRKYSTIQYQTCSQLNQRKVDILKKVKQWEKQEIKRCFNLFKAGASFKGVYESFENDIDSTYKAKITRYASALYVNWCKLKGLPIKEYQQKLQKFKSRSTKSASRSARCATKSPKPRRRSKRKRASFPQSFAPPTFTARTPI